MGMIQQCARCGREYAGSWCPLCPAATTARSTATEELPAGTSFHGLEILSPIGRGGMGVVYRARQKSLGRTVAVKVLPPGRESDSGFLDRFGREAKALATLSHPNIVPIYDFGTDGARPFFVMEYIEGRSLREVFRTRRPTPVELVRLVGQILDGLAHAHRRGVVHRDIKPENVLIDPEGRARVADFGLAKLADSTALTVSGDVLGTFRYMAPEQLVDPSHADARADLYSVGAILYEGLSGEAPAGSFDPPSKRSGSDPRLDPVVMRALARDPAHRHASAEDLKRDLEAAVSGRVTRWTPPLRWAAAGIVLLAVLPVLVFIGFRRSNKPRPEPPPQPPTETRTETPPSFLSRLEFSREDQPGGQYYWKPGSHTFPFPRNPFHAVTPAETAQALTWIAGMIGCPPSELGSAREALLVSWNGCLLVGLDGPAAAPVGLAFEIVGNRWRHRDGERLVLVLAYLRLRDVFVDAVLLAQKKLGLPVSPPPLPLENLMNDYLGSWRPSDQLSRGYVRKPENITAVLALVPEWKEVGWVDIREAYAADFKFNASGSPVRMVVVEFLEESRAARVAAGLKDGPSIRFLRNGKILVNLRAEREEPLLGFYRSEIQGRLGTR